MTTNSVPFGVEPPEARLDFDHDSCGNVNVAHTAALSGPLIEAKKALKLESSRADDASDNCRKALSELVYACSGEIEDVFRGEIGNAMRRARHALGIIHIDEGHEESGE